MSYTEKILEKIGLSENEIKVYLTGLRLGPSLASRIAKEAKLSRTLVYHLLESLEEKGLLSKIGPRHGSSFAMEAPNRLKSVLERRRKELEKVEQELESASAEFESIYAPKAKPSRIRFYEGIEGLKNVAQESLKTKEKEILGLVPIENIFEIFDRSFLKYWSDEREKRKIKSRSIWSKKIKVPFAETDLQKLRLAPKDMKFSTTIIVYDNKVAVFSSPKSLFAFVVESEEFAQTMKVLFESVWKKSK